MRQRTKGMIKINCSNCGEFLEPDRIGKYRYCLDCHAEYMRENRRKHYELFPEAKKRANARSYLNVYIKRGAIKKGPCIVCGTEKNLEAHHEDYDKPLEVIWYCRKHHIEKHQHD